VNEWVLYVPVNTLLGYIGTATSEGMKDDDPFKHTLEGCEHTLQPVVCLSRVHAIFQ